MVNPALLAEAKQLSPTDRLELISAVWDSLEPNEFPVTERERAMIDGRLADLAADPAAGRPWANLEQELRRRLP